MKRFFITLISVETVVLLILFIEYHKLNDKYSHCCESVSRYELTNILVEDEECVFWGMCEDSVVKRLPPPLWHGEVKIKDNGEWTPPPYERYLSKVKDTKDTITIHSYRWYNPFSKLTNVEIIFENVNGLWIATSCTEYDHNVIEF